MKLQRCKILLLIFLIPVIVFAQRAAEGTSVSSSGSVTAGCKSVTFIFSSDFTGTLATVAYNGANDKSYTFNADAGFSLKAIPYVVTTGSIRIMDVR